MKQSNIHPFFDMLCDAIKPYPEFLLSDVEAARIKAEKAMRKLKTINVEIKTLKNGKI